MSPPRTPQPEHVQTLRVYWEDTDAGGVVFYANYLKYFERARTDWLRRLGVSQQRLRCDGGVLFVVAESHVRYHAPARLDDEVEVSVRVVHAGRASMTLEQQALRGSELLAEGTIRIGCVDAATFKPRRMPQALLSRLPAPRSADPEAHPEPHAALTP